MNDSFGGDFNATQTATAGAASEQKAEGNAPVFIKQILESPEGNFSLWDTKFGTVNCTAIVRSIDTSSTKITYLLEDSTGRIESHYWLEEGDTQRAPDVMINKYAKVYGTVRSQAGEKILMIFKMIPVNNPNEILTHILETLQVRYKCESFSNKEGSGDSIWNAKSDNVPCGNGLKGKELAIYEAVRENMTEIGISREDLYKKFKHMKRTELVDLIDFLVCEGHIYSSADADHFLATE